MKETVEVETTNFLVTKDYYSFDFKIWRNGNPVNEGNIMSMHSRTDPTIRKYLEKKNIITKIIFCYLLGWHESLMFEIGEFEIKLCYRCRVCCAKPK